MDAKRDEQGRLYIPKVVRERYGEQYHIVTHADRIELILVSDDPLAAVRDAAGALRDAAIEEIQADIHAVATADARETGLDS